ncbi:M14 family metallopeptidase [Aquirufa sp. 5-AUSEE-100C1]
MKKLTLLLFFLAQILVAQVPSPKSHFGFSIGDNYHLATFTQTEAYFQKVAKASPRAKLQSIGKTEEGRNQYMLIVSSPKNIKNLAKYKAISQRLARAENLTESEAKALAKEGKAVVWIDGGLHATETVGIHQLVESIYQFTTRTDEETMRILDNTIILFVHANPDGQELVSNWYMRQKDTLKRSTEFLPRLYEKYIGHDNNRDFYMMNTSEAANMARQQYIEWMPQILYNHHQTGPEGTVVAGPPYRDPFNYVYDPLLVTGIDALGAAMSSRLNAEGKPGYTMKSGSVYSTWWNGGLRTTAYYHNIIGLLTEIIGSPTPQNIPLVPNRLIPNSATPFPITPRKWLFKNSIDYSLSLNYAVLNYATRYREEVLMNIYKMGRKSIELGSQDYWTLSPNKVEQLTSIAGNKLKTKSDSLFAVVYKNPATRDARAYILTADQSTTQYAFVNILIKSGIRVERATKDFVVNGKTYPKGSYVVKTNQAFRPHVIDMFEPQDHPNDFQYPGGPPVRPYDSAGWTPAFTMGVQFDRILTDLEAPLETIPYGQLQAATPTFVAGKYYAFSTADNASFTLLNALLKAGIEVSKSKEFFYLAHSDAAASILAKAQVKITALDKMPAESAHKLGTKRIGLWDVYGGSMPSGWLRWILEQHQFDFKLVFAKEIDKGNLRSKFDVLIFVRGAIPGLKGEAGAGEYVPKEPVESEIPAEYQETLGKLTAAKSIPSLKAFLEAGGDIITIGTSANLAYHLNLPVKNALVEVVAGKEKELPGEKFYIPGSVMQVSVDNSVKANWGMTPKADIYFSASPVFHLSAEAIAHGELIPLAWYASDKTLRSGWAFGQTYLQDGIAAFQAKVGKGNLYVFGPEVTFRGQTHNTFKMVFNQLYESR